MINIKINGADISADPNDETPLLWFLRDKLHLTGTKFGCGVAACGACTVHVDGQARRACITPLSSLDGSEVVTIEGLAATHHQDADLHPIQQAWIDAQAPQCGYCQSGQIMQAAALLNEVAEPTSAEINAAMAGNLCRCMAYVRIKKAIELAAKATAESVQ